MGLRTWTCRSALYATAPGSCGVGRRRPGRTMGATSPPRLRRKSIPAASAVGRDAGACLWPMGRTMIRRRCLGHVPRQSRHGQKTILRMASDRRLRSLAPHYGTLLTIPYRWGPRLASPVFEEYLPRNSYDLIEGVLAVPRAPCGIVRRCRPRGH
jgi:hypothetical protein